MADYTQGIDISKWQGSVDLNAAKASGIEIVILKVSGSDAGDYVDPQAAINYTKAMNAGFTPATYHFAGGTDPIHEAEYFVNVCSPLDENQVLVLDWEMQHSDPVGWVNTFVTRVHDLTGIWPIVYMNGSTRNAYDWTPVAQNCGFWLAWYGRSPEVVLPVNGSYIAHQYSSTGSVPGISGNVDMDAWFIDVPTFQKYGYHKPVATPQPASAPTPAPTPTPAPISTPVATPPSGTVVTPTPPQPAPAPVKPVVPSKPLPPAIPPKVVVPAPHLHFSLWQLLVAFIKRLFGVK